MSLFSRKTAVWAATTLACLAGNFAYAQDLSTVSIVADRKIATEEGERSGRFTITRTGGDLTQILHVGLTYAQNADNATPGADYDPLPLEVVFQPNVTSISVSVAPFDDFDTETDEYVDAAIVPDDAAYTTSALSGTATVTIISNDEYTGFYVFTGAVDNDASNQLNWNPIGVPGPTDEAYVDGTTCQFVTDLANDKYYAFLGKLTITDTATVNLDAGFSLYANIVDLQGNLIMQQGGATYVAYNFNLGDGLSDGIIGGVGSVYAGNSSIVTFQGTDAGSMQLSGDSQNGLTIGNQAVFVSGNISGDSLTPINIFAEASLDLQSDGNFSQLIVNNYGKLIKSAGVQSVFTSTVDNAGTIEVQTGTLQLLSGTQNGSSGTYLADAGTSIVLQGAQTYNAATFAGAGTFTVLDDINLGGESFLNSTMTYGDRNNAAPGNIVGGGKLTIHGSLTFFGGTVNTGLEVANDGVLTLKGIDNAKVFANNSLTNNGNIFVDSSSNNLTLNSFSVLNQATGTISYFNESDWNFSNGSLVNQGSIIGAAFTGAARIAGTVSNSGQIHVINGILNIDSLLQTAGGTQVDLGATLGGVGTFQINGGTVSGSGDLSLNVDNEGGTIYPGGQGAVGTMNVANSYNYTQGPGGKIDFDIASAGSFDSFAISGTATLNGNVNAILLNGFTPGANDTFLVASFISKTGVVESLSNTLRVANNATNLTFFSNHAPTANDLAFSTNEDVPFTQNLTGSDADSDPITYAIVTNGTKGNAVVNAQTGVVTYTPNADANGTDTFTYVTSDGVINSAFGTVTVSINPQNDAPVISSATASTNTPLPYDTVTFTGAATDLDGDTLNYAWDFGDGSNDTGTSVSHSYAAAGNFTATLTVTDGHGGSVTKTVAVTVTATAKTDLVTGFISVKLNFKKPEANDALTMVGILENHNATVAALEGKKVNFNIGGLPISLTLDKKGKSPTGKGITTTLAVAAPAKKTPTSSKYTLKMTKETIASYFTDEGLINAQVPPKTKPATPVPTVTIKVLATFDGQAFTQSVTSHYKATLNGAGATSK